jgi:hypothetical protein
MFAMGQKQTLPQSNGMSALPPKADIGRAHWDVRFVPKADIEPLIRLSRRRVAGAAQALVARAASRS